MIHLRPYQEEARDWLLDRGRGILADRRGLGKTFPALAAATRDQEDGRFLYVTPAYLMHHADYMIRAWFGEDTPVTLIERGDTEPAHPRSLEGGTWTVVGYPTLTHTGTRKTSWLLARRWDAVIFDEAHHLRNRDTQWVRYARFLSGNSHRVFLLTGTPVVRSPADLWAPLDLLHPGTFGGYWGFAEHWCSISVTPWSKEPKGLRPGMGPAWQKFREKYLLRRAQLSLPEPVEHVIPIPMTPAQAKAYRTTRDEWIAAVGDDEVRMLTSAGALLVELRRITAGFWFSPSPKVETVVGLLGDIDGPAIVWCWHRASAHMIAETLKGHPGRGRPVTVVTGDQPARGRWDLVQRWNEHPQGVLVATIAAVQEGVDLFHAADAIFFEGSYLWSDFDQAIGRIHREGQKAPVVNVYYLEMEHTIDHRITQVAKGRQSISERALVQALREERS